MSEEEIKKVKKEEAKVVKIIVATQIPTEEVRAFVGSDGNNYNVISNDEALTEILETVRLLKQVLGLCII
jgi:hypothetical protein